jgi:hypothetical protein
VIAARGGDTLTLAASAVDVVSTATGGAAASIAGPGGGGRGTVKDVAGGASTLPLAHAAACATPTAIPVTAPKRAVVRIASYIACRLVSTSPAPVPIIPEWRPIPSRARSRT